MHASVHVCPDLQTFMHTSCMHNTYIQAHGGTNCLVKLHDGTGTGGSLQFQAKFSSEGLDIYVPGNGIRFETGVYLDLTTTDSVTIGYTG